MKTKPTTEKTGIEWVRDHAETLRREKGITLPGYFCRPEDRKERRIFWRRAAAVQAAYDTAPAGAEAIAAAVWRKLQSFRPKLTADQLSDLTSTRFRLDVSCIVYGKVSKVRQQEERAAQAADDARRAKRATQQARTKRARKGGVK